MSNNITIDNHTFEILSKYADGSGETSYLKTIIEKNANGGWGIPIDIVYWKESEILWFKKHIKLSETIQFQLKVSIDKLSDVIDMYIKGNNIEIL